MTVWVTADQHFGHANIIKLCGRPFQNVKDMDDEMIRLWNGCVTQDDTVFHLGDFAFGRRRANDLLTQLNGIKHLIKGNHDPKEDLPNWASAQHYREVYLGHSKSVVMSHYGMEDWHGMHRGNTMLHGHSHGQLRTIPGRLDVGVDNVGFAPITLERAVLLASANFER